MEAILVYPTNIPVIIKIYVIKTRIKKVFDARFLPKSMTKSTSTFG